MCFPLPWLIILILYQEFFSKKTDCSLFLFGSHNKKRPNNLIFGKFSHPLSYYVISTHISNGIYHRSFLINFFFLLSWKCFLIVARTLLLPNIFTHILYNRLAACQYVFYVVIEYYHRLIVSGVATPMWPSISLLTP